MAKILIVDDLEVDRDLAGEILRADPALRVETAEDGVAALARIEESAPDLVLTDLVMPNMNGLELVAKLHESHPHVPTILMTSQGSEEIAARALRAGAASYVPKMALVKDLLPNVKRILAVAHQRRDESRLIESLVESESVFVLDSTGSLLGTLVKHLQTGVSRMGLCDEGGLMQIGVALHEALTNAIHHGNLEVDSKLREDKLEAYEAEVAARKHQEPYRDRKVYVTASFSRGEARFVIRDEGPGFEPATLPDPRDPENLTRPSGRGVMLMRAFMDEVHYNDAGNQVTMIKRRGGA